MAHRKTMNVSLTPELERFVAGRVLSGRYRSNSEVLRAALRLLAVQEAAEPALLSQISAGAQLAQQPLRHLPYDD